MSEQDDRAAMLREMARKKVVYYPAPGPTAARVPIVVTCFGYPDPQSQLRMFGPLTSRARPLSRQWPGSSNSSTPAPDDR